jgi:hypothetical protein
MTLDLWLPGLDAQVAQTVMLELQQVGSASEPISCTWALTNAIGVGKWTCTKDRNGNTTTYGTSSLRYDVASLDKSWSIQLTGPTGAKTITRAATTNGSGEGWPGSCACDTFSLWVSGDDVRSVGGVTSGSVGDAGADAG